MRPSPCRNLHWVFKVGDRTANIRFYEDVLLMEPLRHEEFTEGCAAACNGPYDGMWSKTMIGYGPEDDNFVLELTYNYGVKSYQLGNDYVGITIRSKRVYGNLVSKGLGKAVAAGGAGVGGSPAACLEVAAPDGYRFWVLDEEPSPEAPASSPASSSSTSSSFCGAITELRLHVTDLERSLAFWSGFLGLEVRRSEAPGEALLSCGPPGQCELRLVQLQEGQQLERGTAFGRVAFGCPGEQLEALEADVRAAGYAVHTPYVSLDTPGKATVQVVILQDPDGHEVDDLPFVMAYRGASADFPEHSIGAYRAAIQQGAHLIECDVVLSRDLVPLCRHEPNIAQTTDVLLAGSRRGGQGPFVSEDKADRSSSSGGDGGGGGGSGSSSGGGGGGDGSSRLGVELLKEAVVLASDLTLDEVKQLLAIFPGEHTRLAPAAVAVADAVAQQRPLSRCTPGDIDAAGAGGECAAPWAYGQSEDAARSREGAAGGGAAAAKGRAGDGADDDATAVDGLADLRVASLEDLLRMATAVDPAVGVALHIQSASWHNTALLPYLAPRNTTFEDELLKLMQRYGYAVAPYGSEAWRRRPSYIMAFEASSLKYLAQRTPSPLTQVLGPTIPDTGESWDSATSSEGLARIASYASSVAVARQQLLGPVTERPRGPASKQPESPPAQHAAGGDGGRGEATVGGIRSGGGLVALEPLLRMRRAGLQVFVSVFKPAPREQLLQGADTWVDEVAPLLLGTGLTQGDVGEMEAGEAGPGAGQGAGAGRRLGAVVNGLFTDSPRELHRVLTRLRC